MKRWSLSSTVQLILLSCTLIFNNPHHLASGELLWEDNFDDKTCADGELPNATYWGYDEGAGGWGNQEIQTYTSNTENVRCSRGQLILTANETILEGTQRRTFQSARINTKDRVHFRYGRLEAKIKLPTLADGLWPAFWTLGHDIDEVSWPACGEVDVMEGGFQDAIAAGTTDRNVISAAHWENWEKERGRSRFVLLLCWLAILLLGHRIVFYISVYRGTKMVFLIVSRMLVMCCLILFVRNVETVFGRAYASNSIDTDSDSRLNETYHIFRMVWTSSSITTYVGDASGTTFTQNLYLDTTSCRNCRDEFNKAHFILMNIAIGGKFTDIFKSEDITAPFPANYEVDWVRIYDDDGQNNTIPGATVELL